MDEVKCEELIVCSKKRMGKGTKSSPIRVITEVYTKEGELIAQSDPMGGFELEHMIGFARICRSEPQKNIEELFHETYGPKFNFMTEHQDQN